MHGESTLNIEYSPDEEEEEEEEEEDIMEAMNESYSHSSFFIATARQNKDFQISHTLKLA